MDTNQIIGFVAGSGTTLAALPDLIGMLRRKSSAGMNTGSHNIFIWSVIAVITNYLTVGAYLFFRPHR